MQYRPIRFPTGEVRATTAALANVSKEKLIHLVNRQISGKLRVLIITEADRSATTVMLANEY